MPSLSKEIANAKAEVPGEWQASSLRASLCGMGFRWGTAVGS